MKQKQVSIEILRCSRILVDTNWRNVFINSGNKLLYSDHYQD